MEHVRQAFEAVVARPGLLALLGLVPDAAVPDHGWVEPGERLAGAGPGGVHRVRRLHERPAPDLARRLPARRWLWNRLPELRAAFVPVRASLGAPISPSSGWATWAGAISGSLAA